MSYLTTSEDGTTTTLYRVRGVAAGDYDRATRTFTKRVDPTRHYLRKIEGYAISASIIHDLTRRGCRNVHVIENLPNGRRVLLSSDFNLWLSSLTLNGSFTLGGFDRQVGMRRSVMEERAL